MLDDLKRLFSQSWGSFLDELGRRDPEDHIAELLGAMRREMVAARAQLPLLEQNHRATEADLARERRALDDTMRRGAMAERIGDAETVRVAQEFAEKHRRRVAVLEEKVRAAKAEWELRQDETREMMQKYKEAETNRFALLADLRRQGAKQRINSAMGGASSSSPPPSDSWARAEEKIDDASAYADALDDLSDPAAPRTPPPADDIEERLREMKRRMGL